MQNKDSIKNTLVIGIGLCLVCAAIISVIAVGLKELQKSNAILDQQKKIVAAADLKGFYDNKIKVSSIFQDVEKISRNEFTLFNLNYFSEVIPDIYPSETLMDSYDLKINVKEKSTDSIVSINGTSYSNWPRGVGSVKVTYTAGYSSTPADLQIAVIDLINLSINLTSIIDGVPPPKYIVDILFFLIFF